MKRNQYLWTSTYVRALLTLLCCGVFFQQTHAAEPKVKGGGGEQKKISARTVYVSPYESVERDLSTAAVSQIGGDRVANLPGENRTNQLGGLVTGLVSIQSNGEPGIEQSDLYIRGLRTFNNKQALVLVDGYYRRDPLTINRNDIESITILKDAAATAMYGLRGANGVILITTKRGRVQPSVVTFDARVGFQSPTRLPEYLGAYEYATLYNEAYMNDGGVTAPYGYDALQGYYAGGDKYKYPNVNWLDEFLKEETITQNYNISTSGGSSRARYYASAGYTSNSGLFNVDKKVNSYNTNAKFDAYMLRGNVDVDVTKSFSISLDIAGKISKWNLPGDGEYGKIFNALCQLPPNAFPIFNEDGSLSGTVQRTNNPYGLLNYSGYSVRTNRSAEATLFLKEKLNFITQGLAVYGSVSFDSYFQQMVKRNKGFLVYEGSIDNERGTKNPSTQQNTNAFSDNYRSFDLQAGLSYDRTFGKHDLAVRAFLNQNTESGNSYVMPHVYKGLIGSVRYNYDRRYLADITFAYQGSEQIRSDKPYTLFPSLSLGWIISNEEFFNDNSFVSFLKIRASSGLTGNDNPIGYYQKSSFFSVLGTAYLFSTNLTGRQGFREQQIAMSNIEAEKSLKNNVGIDSRWFQDKLSVSVDGFCERNYDLITTMSSINNLLGQRGAIKGNVGKVRNAGVEVDAVFTNSHDKLQYSVYGNFSFARNKIIDQQEIENLYAYNNRTGHPLNSSYGLISDGLFFDAEDILNHATQLYGSVQPGDIKYRNLNPQDDNVVDDNDITYIGRGDIPEIIYGFGTQLAYRGFDLNVHFQGVGNVEKKMSGYTYWEFRPDGQGNVMEHHKSRWVYDPDKGIDTRLTASYPRLSLAGNDTNNRKPNSDYWLKNASYLRLKSVEIGYTLPQRVTKSIYLKHLRVYVNAYNLFTCDNIDITDPEASGSSVGYPLQRTFSLGVNIQF